MYYNITINTMANVNKIKIIRKNSENSWAGLNKLDTAKIPQTMVHIPMPLSNSGAYVNLFKDDEERRMYEKRLGLQEDELLPRSSYWATFTVAVPYTGVTLDLTDTLHKLMYKMLLKSDMVDTPTRLKPLSVAYIEDLEQQTEIINTKAEKKSKAFDLVRTSSIDILRDVLAALGVKAAGLSEQYVTSRLNTIIDGEDPRNTIDDFLTLINEPTLSYKALVFRAVEASVLNRRGGSYFLEDSIIGTSIETTIGYLMDADNHALLTSIKAKVNLFFNKTTV